MISPGKKNNGARACQGAGPAEECCQAGHLGVGGFDRGGEGLVFCFVLHELARPFFVSQPWPPAKDL